MKTFLQQRHMEFLYSLTSAAPHSSPPFHTNLLVKLESERKMKPHEIPFAIVSTQTREDEFKVGRAWVIKSYCHCHFNVGTFTVTLPLNLLLCLH